MNIHDPEFDYDASQFNQSYALEEGWYLNLDGRIHCSGCVRPDSPASRQKLEFVRKLARAGSAYHKEALDIEDRAQRRRYIAARRGA